MRSPESRDSRRPPPAIARPAPGLAEASRTSHSASILYPVPLIAWSELRRPSDVGALRVAVHRSARPSCDRMMNPHQFRFAARLRLRRRFRFLGTKRLVSGVFSTASSAAYGYNFASRFKQRQLMPRFSADPSEVAFLQRRQQHAFLQLLIHSPVWDRRGGGQGLRPCSTGTCSLPQTKSPPERCSMDRPKN